MNQKDGTPKPFDVHAEVIYIPKHLLSGERHLMEKHENLGVVTSKNEKYVFVKYLGKTTSNATSPKDLYFIDNRPDLKSILREENIDVN